MFKENRKVIERAREWGRIILDTIWVIIHGGARGLLFLLLISLSFSQLPTNTVNATPSKREYLEGTYDASNTFYGVNWKGQTFTTDNNQAHTVSSVKIPMRRSDAATTIYAYIYAVDGSHHPTGSYLAKSAGYDTTPVGSTEYWGELTFASPPVLSKNTEYCLVVENSVGDSSHKIMWLYHTDDAYAGGLSQSSVNSGSSWGGDSLTDRKFQIWGEDATANITITSTFTGSGYVVVDGDSYSTPHSFIWTVGDSHNVTAATNRLIYSNVERKVFSSWSNAGARSQSYTVTIGAKTVTATYHTEFKHIVTSTPITGTGKIYFNGTAQSAPFTSDWIDSGATFTVNATLFPAYPYAFESWSDGATLGRLHTVNPSTSANYTATFSSYASKVPTATVNVAGNATITWEGDPVTTPDAFETTAGESYDLIATAPPGGEAVGVTFSLVGNATMLIDGSPVSNPHHFADGSNHTATAYDIYTPGGGTVSTSSFWIVALVIGLLIGFALGGYID